jgi:carbonic anhydrase
MYRCGGVLASMKNTKYGLIDHWLGRLKDIYRANKEKLEGIKDYKSRADLMCELNVMSSVETLAATTIIQDAWARGQSLQIHGWCYRLSDGLVRDLGVHVKGPQQLDPIFRFQDKSN